MKTIIRQLIDDFHERPLPVLTKRGKKLPAIHGKTSVVIGMRRTGKTYFCYQQMQALLAAGIEMNQIFYRNFEDEHVERKNLLSGNSKGFAIVCRK